MYMHKNTDRLGILLLKLHASQFFLFDSILMKNTFCDTHPALKPSVYFYVFVLSYLIVKSPAFNDVIHQVRL